MEKLPVSVVIPTRDEADNLPACLASVAWADEVLVIDGGSRDRTVEIARAAGARVLERPFTGYGDQRNHAAREARHDWILCLDADERVPPALGQEIAGCLGQPAHPGFLIPRSTRFAGRVIRHCGWQNDRVLRLYDRRHGRWDDRLVHERVELDAAPGQLRTPLEHHTYRSFSHYAAKSLGYAELGAREAWRAGRRAGPASLLLLPAARFFKMYVLRLGFLDGLPGLLLCSVAAYGVLAKYATLWELGREGGKPATKGDRTAWH